jgi:hypothetical protein
MNFNLNKNKINMNLRNLILLLLITIFISSCGSIKPVAPTIEVGTYTAPKQELSMISIPIEMELKNYFKAADNAVPYEFKGKEQQCDGVSFEYKFDRKPIQIEGKGNYVDIEIEGKYGISLSYCAKCTDLFSAKPSCMTPRIPASCGVDEPMRRIKIQYGTEIELKKDFKIEAKTELKKIDPKDKCQVTVFSYDATGHLVTEVKKVLEDLSGKIDSEIESLAIKKEVDAIWESFTKPFPIDKYGYLTLNPKAIEVENLKIKGTKLEFNVGISANPKITLSKPEEKNIPLPNLSELKHPTGLSINVDIVVPYDSLNSIINKSLVGKVIDIKNQKIIIQNAKIFGASNQQLSIEVGFTGSKTGVMFFKGTPTIIDSLQTISFPDIEFDLETKNVLLKSAKWMFDKKITNMIRDYSEFNLKPYLKDASKMIEQQMNTKIDKNINLKGKVNETKIKHIYPDKNELLIQTNLSGKLSVKID